MNKQFELMVKECAQINGIQSFDVFDEVGRLVFGSVTVDLKPTDYDFEGERILVESEIIRLDENISSYVLRLLLAINIGFEYTKGCSIGVVQDDIGQDNKEGGVERIVISKILSPQIDTGEKLSEQVKLFVELVDSWKIQINSVMHPLETGKTEEPDRTNENMMMV